MDTTTGSTSTTMATFDDFDTTFVGQLDASANLVEYRPVPVPASPVGDNGGTDYVPETPPPVTPPLPVWAPATEPPALLRRRITHRPDTDDERQFVRTFRAERAGSDTESDNEALLPVPTSPLMRQVACAAVVSDAETEADETEAEEEAETEADEADEAETDEADEAEAEADEAEAEEEVELQQGTPETIIEIPRWLFATTLIAMLVYILFAVYLLTLRCDTPPSRY